MPVAHLKDLTLDDMEAVYTFVSNLHLKAPATGDKLTQPPARYCSSSVPCAGSGETCNSATNECYGGACTTNAQCGACQTCTSGACALPTGTCPTLGL
jgi:hypothetical protein